MEPLTPDQFKSDVVAVVKEHCRCAVPGFQKIVSFNFEDYGIAPTLLWDSEILIHEVIRNGYKAIDEGIQRQGDSKRRYMCRICSRTCTETYTEFSINMYRSFVRFDEDLRAPQASYVLGYRGFEGTDFCRITDFSRTDDFKAYLASLTETNSEQDSLGNPLPAPWMSRRVATNLNLKRRGAPGSGLPGLNVLQEMKPFLGDESTIRVGVEAVIESDSPDGMRGVVFEDDGETGYFYARDFSRPEHYFIDALHVYDVSAVVDPERPSVVRIIWSRDFMVAALLINQHPHVIFHFGECCGYAEHPFPEADPKSGWTHEVLHPGLKELFHPKV